MSSVLVTSLGRPEHPCGCPVPALEPRGSRTWTGCSPLHFPAHPQERDDADCPAGGSSRSSPAPAHGADAMRILTGSRARNSPGTVLKVTAWVGSIQIGMPPPVLIGASRPGQDNPGDERGQRRRGGPEGPPRRYGCCRMPCRSVAVSRGQGRGLHHPDGWPHLCPAQRPGSRTARSSAWRTSRPWPLRSARP